MRECVPLCINEVGRDGGKEVGRWVRRWGVEGGKKVGWGRREGKGEGRWKVCEGKVGKEGYLRDLLDERGCGDNVGYMYIVYCVVVMAYIPGTNGWTLGSNNHVGA